MRFSLINKQSLHRLLPAVALALAVLSVGLAYSDEATREYVRCYHVLTLRVLDEAHRTRPDVVVRTADGHLALIDVKGTPRRGPVDALETASAEAPFGPWTATSYPSVKPISPDAVPALSTSNRCDAPAWW